MYSPKFNYQPIPRVVINGQRYYATADGKNLASVTTILDKTKPEESKRALNEWRKRVGVDQAKKITQEAANRGTRMHSYLEHYIRHGKVQDRGTNPYSWASYEMANTIIGYGLGQVNEFWGIEVPLYFPDVYAGTTDLLALHENQEAIVDFKQTNRAKKREWIDDYFLQICAYAEAHNEVYKTKIKKGVIMMCVKPQLDSNFNIVKPAEYQEFRIEGAEFEEYRVKWWQRVEEFFLINR